MGDRGGLFGATAGGIDLPICEQRRWASQGKEGLISSEPRISWYGPQGRPDGRPCKILSATPRLSFGDNGVRCREAAARERLDRRHQCAGDLIPVEDCGGVGGECSNENAEVSARDLVLRRGETPVEEPDAEVAVIRNGVVADGAAVDALADGDADVVIEHRVVGDHAARASGKVYDSTHLRLVHNVGPAKDGRVAEVSADGVVGHGDDRTAVPRCRCGSSGVKGPDQ